MVIVPTLLQSNAGLARLGADRRRRMRNRLLVLANELPVTASENAKEAQKQSCQCSAEHWTDDRDRRVAPIGPTFSGDRQNGVGDARTQVARWIDGIAGGAAQGKPDAPHQAAHKIRAQSSGRTRRRHLLRENRANYEDENKRCADFTE